MFIQVRFVYQVKPVLVVRYFTVGKTESGIDKDLITVEGDKSDEEDYEIAVTLRIGQYSLSA